MIRGSTLLGDIVRTSIACLALAIGFAGQGLVDVAGKVGFCVVEVDLHGRARSWLSPG